VVESWIPLQAGSIIFTGTNNFQTAENETCSRYQLSIRHKTYARHEFCSELIPSAWPEGGEAMPLADPFGERLVRQPILSNLKYYLNLWIISGNNNKILITNRIIPPLIIRLDSFCVSGFVLF